LAKELEYFSPSFANEFRVEKKTRKERKMGRKRDITKRQQD